MTNPLRVHRDLEYKEVSEKTSGSLVVLTRDILLPTWNMDSVASITFTFGTTLGVKDLGISGYKRIIDAWCDIIADDGTYVLSRKDIWITRNGTTLTINRVAGGLYDSASYDSTTSSRGVLYLKISI